MTKLSGAKNNFVSLADAYFDPATRLFATAAMRERALVYCLFTPRAEHFISSAS
jgi:hypothetical protein